MKKIKHSDLRKGLELPYQDARNAGWFGVITRVIPRVAGYPGCGWTRYYICQRSPEHGLNVVGSEYTIGQVSRTFRLP